MTDAIEPKSPEELKWPSVEVAYDFVLPSYQLMAARIEAIVTRIQALMTLAATLTLGAPVLARSIKADIHFWSAPFIAAIGLFIVLMVIGIAARDYGEFMLINPGKLYQGSLHLSEWDFKRAALFDAGRCFRNNSSLANRKAELGQVMSILILLEVLCLVVWIVRSV